MRIINLTIKNWRGIDERYIEFSDGVTIVEGPNEVGKSTIVEAVRLLFGELDSSKKQTVQAIKPVNKDVGSTIELEMTCGVNHFTYSKTFNKSSQTFLSLIAPSNKQITGREAHETVQRLLDESVDMALWEALLVDQGEKVALASIQDSAALIGALDEAAGGTGARSDDSALYDTVQSEYERYFSLKTEKKKYSDEEQKAQRAEQSFGNVKQLLKEVENTIQDHDRSATEVRRLKVEVPRLKSVSDQHNETWLEVSILKQSVDDKHRALTDAEEHQAAVLDAKDVRDELVEDIKQSQGKVDLAKEQLEPLKQSAKLVSQKIEATQSGVDKSKLQVKAAKSSLKLVLSDEQHIKLKEKLRQERKRVSQLQDIKEEKQASIAVVGTVHVKDDSLEQLREVHSQVEIARGMRNTAATTVSITAEKQLNMDINGDSISMSDSDSETRVISEKMALRIPDIVSITVTPPKSVDELQLVLEEAEEDLTGLLHRLDVGSLEEAVSANERRANAQRELDRLKAQEQDILAGSDLEENEQTISSYQQEVDRYTSERQSKENLPENVSDAEKRVSTARSDLDTKEIEQENTQEKLKVQQQQHGELDRKLRNAEHDLAGLEAALKEKKGSLEVFRSKESDEDLNRRVVVVNTQVSAVQSELKILIEKLDAAIPDAIEELKDNAQNAWERAQSELTKEETNLAVLSDRLQQSQADGRFEAMDAAQRELEKAQSTLDSIKKRASAAELLWHTLNKHRDVTRKTYVRPLKEAVERLGQIVFGNEFEIELGDDWAILSRTLDGITVPFESLSIGAKEQLGILVRLAASQIVSKQEGVPLIIDDALGFSDPTRLETMGAAINAAGKSAQIIILTCTPGRFTHIGSAKLVKIDRAI